MKSTETKWTKLVSIRIEKEIIENLNKDNSNFPSYFPSCNPTLSQKINYILSEYIKEKEKKNN